jgi:hypothetical protein
VYDAFENDRTRMQWLDGRIVVKSATARKRMRLALPDGTAAIVGFLAKGPEKSIVAVEHQKLTSRAEIEACKKQWGKYFDRLTPIVTVAV